MSGVCLGIKAVASGVDKWGVVEIMVPFWVP